MKVVFVHTDFRIYWPARLKAVKEYLHRKEISVEVIEISGKGSPYSFAENTNKESSDWHILFPDDEMESISCDKANAEVRKKLGEISPDIVFAGAIAFPSGAAAVRWGVENNRRVVIFDDARLEDTPRSFFVNLVKRTIYSGVDGILTSSPMMNKTYSYFGFAEEQIFHGVTVVDNSFWQIADTLNFRNLPDNFFLTIGRQIPKKNLKFLLKSYLEYSGIVADPKKLVLVGEGPERPGLEDFVRENNLDNVHFLPYLSQEDLRSIYKQALCFILPSLYSETWGLTVNESMASGLPVLVSNQIGCASTIVREGINGYTFSPEHQEELTEVLLKIHEMPESEIKTMGKMSLEIISEWGLERFCTGVDEAIRYVSAHHRKKTGLMTRLALYIWKGRYRPV
jgi:1,2-diacylglycerol 3-alpha-glucosyltransferase